MTPLSSHTFASSDVARLLRHAWHPVALSKDVPTGTVRGASLLAQELVLARLSEGLLAADVACPHKGSRLSLGRICDGDLQCPTHGWRFDAGGHCINLPPLLDPSLQKMAAASLHVYHVQERYGLIWVQLEEDASVTLPEIPELSRGRWPLHFGQPLHCDCGIRRATEGFLDVSAYLGEDGRLPHLYHETFNGDNKEPLGFAARADFSLPDSDEEDPHERTYRCYAPSIITVRQKWSYGERLWFFVASPLTETSCTIFWGLASGPNFEGAEIEEQLAVAQAELEKNRRVSESQLPHEIPFEPDRCGWGILVTPGDVISDQFQRAFRVWVLRLKGMGK